ncbi:MAG: DUF1801 domain-containing protein [Planctomycetes bacterium]|nr:DUF1801 domain-containing protein [Planctomycetota bacterium]
MQSKATTVKEYLAELPADRRAAVSAVRDVILKNLDKDFEEGMTYGMIGYYVPHRIYPNGYHCDPRQPLPFAGLASQKNHMSLYVMSLYSNSDEEKRFRAAWAKTGKKLDMGKCCIRFKKLDDLPLNIIADMFRRTSVKQWIAYYEKSMLANSQRKTKGPPGKAADSASSKKNAKKVVKKSRKKK